MSSASASGPHDGARVLRRRDGVSAVVAVLGRVVLPDADVLSARQ